MKLGRCTHCFILEGCLFSTCMKLTVNLEYLLCRWCISISVKVKWILFDKNMVYRNSTNILIIIVWLLSWNGCKNLIWYGVWRLYWMLAIAKLKNSISVLNLFFHVRPASLYLLSILIFFFHDYLGFYFGKVEC